MISFLMELFIVGGVLFMLYGLFWVCIFVLRGILDLFSNLEGPDAHD